MYMFMCTSMYVYSMYVCMYVFMNVCMYARMYAVCMYVLCMYARMYVVCMYRSQWPHGLRRWSAAVCLLGLRIPIPPVA